MENPYLPIEAEILDIVTETPTIKTLVVKPAREINFTTGQFVELTVPGQGEAPFTPSSFPAEREKMEITVMKVGLVTEALHRMKAREKIGIRGPYGQGYPLKELEGKEILIVGGGVGLAPLRSLLLSLFSELDKYKKIHLRYGARTPQDIVYKNQLPQWGRIDKVNLVQTVDVGDNGWKGNVGLVTSIVSRDGIDIKNSVAIVCGPPIMMRFTTLKLLDIGYKPKDIFLSMEKNMSCGIGKCGHCRLGPYYVCQDGPVFTYETLKEIKEEIWE